MSMRNNNLTVAEKKRKIKSANKSFLKKHKLEDNPNVKIGILSENEDMGNIEQFKTGNVAVDVLTGGFFLGLINVIYGGPGSSKSTTIRDMVSFTQKEYDAVTLYMNQEKTMDRNYWEQGGVDISMLEVGEFETTEQSLDLCNKAATGEHPVDMLVIDTLQALSPEGELYKGKDQKSTSDNTMALLPRLYSQFLRMYTSCNTGLTTILVSQIRTAGIGGGMAFDGMTGGNAIKHYCHMILKMTKSDSATAWPYSLPKLPPNSFVVNYKNDRIKEASRYKGLTIRGYFYKGKLDRRFNIIALVRI
jgi:RecA/RadA recombinase